ncbi:MAG: YceI family protein [Methylotetracoccus sp.]|jgi:polyisoprenoid-binding protein YceI|nr:YceI family protein [Methylotetracoccus sp.]
MRKVATLVLASLTAASAVAADSYTIDPNHTLPVFEVNHLGFTTQRGRFDKTSGKIQLDREKNKGAVDWTIEADSINMGQTKWNDHLKSADFFNAAQFPTITYHSEKLLFQGSTPVSAEGSLTLLGVTKPLKVKIHRFTCGTNPMTQKDLCAADIEATLKRSEFGMTKYLPGVGDEVRVLVPVEAYKD